MLFRSDRNAAQLHLLELKLAAIRSLDEATIWRLFAMGRLRGVRGLYVASLRPLLMPPARKYWDRQVRIFEVGLHGHNVIGFGMQLLRLGIRVQAGSHAVAAIVASPDLPSQANLWRTRFRRRVMGSRAVAGAALPALVHLMTLNQKQRRLLLADGYSSRVLERVDALLGWALVARNPYWQLALTGRPAAPRDECDWLQPGAVAVLRPRIAAVYQWRGDLVDALRARPANSLDAIDASDVPDWLAPAARLDLLDVAAAALRPGGRLLVRSASRTPPLPDDDRFELDSSSAALTASERTALYGSVRLLLRR